ncbi:unnamed protein product [Allacma fusca]|uniref:Uncharacterized protein n=1 Tax=Allacma fusca TaxID=39272 RepID=A0A8J2PIL0_9HEXA|nr:unnamed protein product [Allacma fusca]
MESPKPRSESNLRRYKGIRSSKIGSLYSDNSEDLYVDQTTGNDDDDDDSKTVLTSTSLRQGHFLTALGSETQRPQSALEPTRMAQLETLEAKMANIEVSLSSLGPRRKRNGTTRSLHSSHLGGNGSSVLREFHKEMEYYKQSVKDKENLILNLQAQLRKLSKRKLVHGSITSTDSGVVSLRILSENERKAAEERLAQLDKDMDIKRNEIKRINLRLERLHPSDNIDVRIEQAELEYELEREELNLMNLQEERRNLHSILDDNDAFQRRTENSLFNSMPLNAHVAVHSFEVLYDVQDPSFTVGKREDKNGTYVTWTRDGMKTLKRGDRIIEINGTTVISKGVNRIEEFWSEDDQLSPDDLGLELSSHPLRMVIMRTPPPPPPPRAPSREIHTLREELALVTAKLEQVSAEKRDVQCLCQKLQKEHQLWEDETEKFRLDTDKLAKERDNLKTESVRLKHRISYLEEQVTDLLHRKEMNNQAVTVFQKGNQKTIVAEPIKTQSSAQSRSSSPNRPPSVASSRACESRQALKTRLWETFRRATTSDSRSVCSVDSHKPAENGYFKKRSDSKKKLKPQPPTKPVRLSLQRATSTTNVYPSELPEMNPGLKRSNYSENTLLPDWTSDDLRSEPEQKQKRSSKHGIRWPSLRPASSMSYTMSSRNNQVAKF